MSLCLFPTSLNTVDFVNRVDQAHRLQVYRPRTTRSRRPGIVAPVEFVCAGAAFSALYVMVKSKSRMRRAVVGQMDMGRSIV